jgi:superfamily II DNA or RNA helicase
MIELKPRWYQQAAIDHAVNWSRSAGPGSKILYAGPTGIGKSLIELKVQESLPGWWIITPRLAIARSILEKHGEQPGSLRDLIETCFKHRISTPVRFRNMLYKGLIDEVPGLIIDEGHHASADTYVEGWLATGMPPTMLFTATPFRRDSKSTLKFREQWGEPNWIISFVEAAQLGDISVPDVEVLPLVDDDLIQLSSTGEFDVTSLDSETGSRIDDMAEVARQRFWNGLQWDRATVFCMPSVNMCKAMRQALHNLGLQANVVSAATPEPERMKAFSELKSLKAALVQVAVLGEGVDLPVRRMIDMAPCMSPVKWLQSLGRCTRPVSPGEARPVYICTNRNIVRHSYLLEGLIPSTKISEAVQAFGSIGNRFGARAIGLECLGRFKGTNLKLVDGNVAQFYTVVDAKGGRLTEYACLLHPASAEPIWGKRNHESDNGVKKYGEWKPCPPPEDLQGFVSVFNGPVTEPMLNWWKKSAVYHGLLPDVALDRRRFAALPFCKNLNLRLARRIG